MQVVLYSAIVNLKANDGWIVVGVTMVGHRHDTGFHAGHVVAIACCRSVVKVPIPQRRGSEFPINARRLTRVTRAPRLEPSGDPAVARR